MILFYQDPQLNPYFNLCASLLSIKMVDVGVLQPVGLDGMGATWEYGLVCNRQSHYSHKQEDSLGFYISFSFSRDGAIMLSCLGISFTKF